MTFSGSDLDLLADTQSAMYNVLLAEQRAAVRTSIIVCLKA